MESQIQAEPSVQRVLMKTIQAPLKESMGCAGERERERMIAGVVEGIKDVGRC
jgi:hypothetical protein